MTYRTVSIPLYVLDDSQLMDIANALMAVENNLMDERGPDEQSRNCVDELMAELDRRATTTYSVKDGKLYRNED